MMRPFGKIVLTLGALALLASPAWAQGRGGFGLGMGGGAGFLMAENVQKDLKLSDQQVEKIRDVLREVAEKHRDEYREVFQAPSEERTAKMATLNKTVNDEIKKALSLSDEQSKRFDQISLQARGFQAFADPAVASKLKLTDDQKSKIREMAESSRPAGGAFNKDASKEERTEAFRKMAETQRQNLAKVQAMLTDDQKKAWKDMTGEPIEIQLRRPGN